MFFEFKKHYKSKLNNIDFIKTMSVKPRLKYTLLNIREVKVLNGL
jgi:hypothetical protein